MEKKLPPKKREKAGSLYELIRGDIQKQILSGAYLPGHKLPIEQEIMAQYGCSRMTVSKALSLLVDDGLVVRRKRAGSFVASPKIHSAVLQIPDIQAEILSRNNAYRFAVISIKKLPGDSGSGRSAEEPTQNPHLEIVGRHFSGEEIFALERRRVNLTAVPEIEAADFRDESPGSWLLRCVPWTQAEHRISAITPDAATARLMKIGRDTACLRLERETWRDERWVTAVEQIFPGYLFDLRARFSPGNQNNAM